MQNQIEIPAKLKVPSGELKFEEHESRGSIVIIKSELSQTTEIRSATFWSDTNEDVKWCIKVRVWRHPQNVTVLPSLCLMSTNRQSTVRAKATLFLCNAIPGERLPIDTIETTNLDGGTNQHHNWSSTSIERLNKLVQRLENIVLSCDVTEYSNISNYSFPKTIHVTKCDITEHYDVLFKTKEWSDVTIIAKGQIEFKAHKLILIARSSVFAAMFNNAMAEQQTNRIEIEDIEPKVMEEMLRFIYTGQVNNISEIAIELLAAAEKYDLKRLKIMCETELEDTLEIENAAHILTLADIHDCKQLKEVAKRFIVHYTKEVMRTEGYRLMVNSHLQLVEEILQALVFKNSICAETDTEQQT